MTNELEDWQLALLVEARKYDDPVIVESAEAEALQRAESLLEQADGIDHPEVVSHETARQVDKAEALLEATEGVDAETVESLVSEARGLEEPKVVSGPELEANREATEAVEGALANALSDQYGLRDPLIEQMDAATMLQQFQDEEEDVSDFDLAALAQQPETGGAPSSEAASGSGAVSDLDPDTKAEAKDMLERAERMKNRTPEYSASLRQEAADLVGVDDADELSLEAF